MSAYPPPPASRSLMPPIGTLVTSFYLGASHTAEVISLGRHYPVIRFRLKNGRVVCGRATIVGLGELPSKHKHILAQIRDEPDLFDPAKGFDPSAPDQGQDQK